MGWILGPAAAGLYYVALKLGMALTQAMMLVGQTLYPELSKLAVAKQFQNLNRVVLRTGLIAVAMGLLVLAILSVVGDQILALYGGAGFDAAFGVLILIALASTIQLFGFPLSLALVACGRPDSVLKIKLTASVLLFPVLLGLLKLYDLKGAGFYAVIFAIAILISMTATYRKYTGRQT